MDGVEDNLRLWKIAFKFAVHSCGLALNLLYLWVRLVYRLHFRVQTVVFPDYGEGKDLHKSDEFVAKRGSDKVKNYQIS